MMGTRVKRVGSRARLATVVPAREHQDRAGGSRCIPRQGRRAQAPARGRRAAASTVVGVATAWSWGTTGRPKGLDEMQDADPAAGAPWGRHGVRSPGRGRIARRLEGARAGRRGDELLTREGEQGVARRAEQTVVADLGEALGQHVLRETAEERQRVKGAAVQGARAAVAVAERDLAIVEAFEAAVDDGDAEDVAGEIVEHLLPSPGRLDVDDPLATPDGGRRLIEEPGPAEAGADLGAEEPGQRPSRNEEGGVGGGAPTCDRRPAGHRR
jgi:hypothetical protein